MLIDVFVTLFVIIAPPLRLSTFDGGGGLLLRFQCC